MVKTTRTKSNRGKSSRARRWGKPRPRRTFKKLHGLAGRITGILTAIQLTDEDVHDITQFWPMIKQLQKNHIPVARVFADGAYPGEKMFVKAIRKGIELWTPVRRDWNPDTKHTLGPKLAREIKARNDLKNPAFAKGYGGRNRSESAWSQIKLMCGGFLWSRNMVERMCEILSKAIAYNLCKINQYEIEWGTRIDFGADTKFRPRWSTGTHG